VSPASDHPATRAGWETLLDNRPNGQGVRTDDGNWMHFDLTELYRTWAEGGPFPSQERTVRRGTPLVVDVRAANFGQPRFELRRPRSAATGRPRRACAGRRPATAEPRWATGKVPGKGDDREEG
jgi:hypothetical protein